MRLMYVSIVHVCVLLIGMAAPRLGQCGVVVTQGYDLLSTVGATFDFGGAGGLGLVSFVGRPLNTFDFGTGAVNVGSTDTILHRLSTVNLPDLPTIAQQTINIEMVALSLQSATPIDWSAFGGLANESVITMLVGDRGSTMTIHNGPFDSAPDPDVYGVFDSNLNFAIRLQGLTSGALSPVIGLNFTQTGALWTHDPPKNAVIIDGINHKLNGIDTSTDFFTGLAHHVSGPHTHDTITAVPEPSSLVLFGAASLVLVIRFRQSRRGYEGV